MKTRATHATNKRNEDSVQASLAELRNLEVARLQAERIAEEERRAADEERAKAADRAQRAAMQEAQERRLAAEYERERQRLAAQHELELAKERARTDAEARVEERRLELEIRQAESAMLQAKATMPRKGGLAPVLIIAALLLAVQGVLFAAQMRQGDQSSADIARVGQALAAADTRIAELQETVEKVGLDNAELRKELERARDAAPTSTAAKGKSKNGTKSAKPKPNRGKTTGKVGTQGATRGPITLDKSCLDDPLC